MPAADTANTTNIKFHCITWNPNIRNVHAYTSLDAPVCAALVAEAAGARHDSHSQQHDDDDERRREHSLWCYMARPGITNSMNILASGWPQPAHRRLRGHQNSRKGVERRFDDASSFSICIFNLTCRAHLGRPMLPFHHGASRCAYWFHHCQRKLCPQQSANKLNKTWARVGIIIILHQRR